MVEPIAKPTPLVPITLAGVEYGLRYTTRSFVTMEDTTGKAPGEIAARVLVGSQRAISTMVWAGLLWMGDEAPKLDTVINMIDLRQVDDELAPAINRALSLAKGLDPDTAEKTEKAAEGNPRAAG